MASQLSIVTRNKRKRDQLAELQGRQSLLPAMIANQQRQEEIQRSEQLKNEQMKQLRQSQNLAENQYDAQQRASRIGMGLEAGKLGLNIGTIYGGKKSVGDAITGVGGTVAPNSLFNDIDIGTMFGSGLAGFGASRLVNKKKKGARFGLGAGVGALLGGLTGGWGGALGGGVSGGLGSLF